jgi:hypothetical protein
MSRNFLDLRSKIDPQVVVVEKLVTKSRSRLTELARFCLLLAIVSISVWGITKANEELTLSQQPVVVKNFSTIGAITDISNSSISINNVKGTVITPYTFNTATLRKIETKAYVPLALSDLKVGDRIILQGLDENGIISIRRIISFSVDASADPLNVITASTTENRVVVKTPPPVETVATTTNILSDATASSTSVMSTVKDTITTVIDAFFGTSTPDTSTSTPVTTSTTTSDISTSTATSSLPVVETSTPTTTEETPVSTSTTSTIINQVVETVTEVIETITGTEPTPTTETPAPEPAPLVEVPVETPTE